MFKNKFWLVLGLTVVLSLAMVACEAETVTVVETVVVEKEGETIVETVEVEVEKEVVVEKEVEVIVDPTECNLDAPAEEVTINHIGWSFPITDYYAEELEKCSKVENITVNTSMLGSSDVVEQVRLAMSTGGDSPYDIIHASNSNVGEYGSNGWLYPLNDLVEKYWDEYNLGDIPQVAWDGVTLDGQIYGVPMVGNTLHQIYRMDLFEENGWEVPETYADVIELCNTIGLDNPDYDMPYGVSLSYARAWELEFFQILYANGGTYLDENSMPMFNSPEGVEAMELVVDVAEACLGDYGVSLSLNDQEIAMQLGTLPATKMWASRAANMSDPERTDLVDVIGYAPAPRVTADGPRAGSAWNDFYMIPATTVNDPELVFLVIMEAADERSQRDAAEVGMATRMSVAQYGGPYMEATSITIAEGVGNYSKDPANSIAIAKLEQFLALVYTGEMTAQEALDAAAEAYIEEATAQGYIDG